MRKSGFSTHINTHIHTEHLILKKKKKVAKGKKRKHKRKSMFLNVESQVELKEGVVWVVPLLSFPLHTEKHQALNKQQHRKQ